MKTTFIFVVVLYCIWQLHNPVAAKPTKSAMGPYLPPLLIRTARTYFQPIKRASFDNEEQVPQNSGGPYMPPLYSRLGRTYFQPIKRASSYEAEEQLNFAPLANPPVFFSSDGRLYLAGRPVADEE